jgi:hypothetical protein
MLVGRYFSQFSGHEQQGKLRKSQSENNRPS